MELAANAGAAHEGPGPVPFLRSGGTSTVKSFLATMGEAGGEGGLRSRDSPVEGQ